ncbi:MAG: DUF6252 family protein [Bacteroidia bacterium]
MKIQFTTNLILLLILFTGSISFNMKCETDNDKFNDEHKTLPPATQIGANTFGCKVNGKVWLPEATPWVWFHYGELDIRAEDFWVPKDYVSIILGKFTVSDTGSYALGGHTPYYSRGYYSREKKRGYEVYETDNTNTGTITITRLDTSMRRYIVSGTFSFKAKDKVTGEIVEVTDGRFDLKNY